MRRLTLAIVGFACAATSAFADSYSPNELSRRAIERRAVEAAIWGMPAVNYDLMLQEMQYWSVTAYDRETHALIKGVDRASRASNAADLEKNADGSVDIVFGPKAPEGKESTGSRPTPIAASS